MGDYETAADLFHLGGFKATGGTQDVYLIYPVGASGPFPFVAFAHGCCKKSPEDTRNDYDALYRDLAIHGVVVGAFFSCQNWCGNGVFSTDQLHLIDALQSDPSLHPMLPQVDFQRVTLMGHSLGGGATITSAASGHGGVVAAAAIHPSAGDAADVKVPTFYLCGEKDTTVSCPSVKKQYQKTAVARSVFAELQGAGHLEIQKPLPGGRWNYYLVQFALCHLQSSKSACDVIYGAGGDSLCSGGLMVDCEVQQGYVSRNSTVVV